MGLGRANLPRHAMSKIPKMAAQTPPHSSRRKGAGTGRNVPLGRAHGPDADDDRSTLQMTAGLIVSPQDLQGRAED
jgi:hypothetical protein